MTPSAVFALISLLLSSTYLCFTSAEVLNKGDRGDAVTLGTVSSTDTKDLIREATGYERPIYGTQTWYPPSGSNKGWSRPSYAYPSQGGYPGYGANYGSYQGNYQSGYGSQIRGGYPGNQVGYGNNKGWPSTGSSWGGNYGRPVGGSYGNYKGGTTNQGWYGGQSGYGDRWLGGNQLRPSSSGYIWPSRGGYRGDKGYSGTYGGTSGIYGGSSGGYGGSSGGYGGSSWGNPGYGGGYINQDLNTGIGNQIYGSGYSGYYGNQKGWGSAGYGNVPNQGGYWGTNTWSNQGYQGNYKGGSNPRINTINSAGWSNARPGYGSNYPNSKGW